jgi:hypothetical protein
VQTGDIVQAGINHIQLGGRAWQRIRHATGLPTGVPEWHDRK